METDTKSSKGRNIAIKLKRFSKIQYALVALSIILIATGSILAFNESLWVATVGATLIGAGVWIVAPPNWVSISNDPPTCGAIFVWGQPYAEKGQQVAVGYKTLTANYFPFFVSVRQVVLANKSQGFDITVYPKIGGHKIKVSGKLILTGHPNTVDLPDYFQAGGAMDAVFEQIRNLVDTTAEEVSKNADYPDLVEFGNKLGKEVLEKLDASPYGVVFFEASVNMEAPAEIVKAMEAAAVEGLERVAEGLDYDTIQQEATKLQERINADYKAGRSDRYYTFAECLQEVKDLKLIKQGRTSAVKTSSKPVVIASTGSSKPTT